MATRTIRFEVTGCSASELTQRAEEIARGVGTIEMSEAGIMKPHMVTTNADGHRRILMWEQEWQFAVRTEG